MDTMGVPRPLFTEAMAVVLDQPGRDPSECENDCPISLINTEAKILAKVLASRLEGHILSLIGHQQGRLGADNTRLFLNVL